MPSADAELTARLWRELPDPMLHPISMPVLLLHGCDWAAGLPRMQGAAIEAALRAATGVSAPSVLLLSAASAISKKTVPGTSTLPLILQCDFSPSP